MQRIIGRRVTFVLIATILTLAALPAGAAADTPINHSGNTGTHALGDTPEYPGATCRYNSSGSSLLSIRVRWPHVEGYSWTAGLDRQKVGWRFKILRGDDFNGGGPFTTVYTSPIATAFTYDNKAATWPSRTYTFPSAPSDGFYTVDVLMYWFHPTTNAITGTARHRTDWSRAIYGGGSNTAEFPCPWSL